MSEIKELTENPSEMELIDHLAGDIESTGEELGQAEAAPETPPVEEAEATASTDDKGQADKAPEGQADAAPDEAGKQTEQPADAPKYTPEEIAAAFKAQASYKEAQAAMTRATQEAATLRNKLEAIEAKTVSEQSPEEYLMETVNARGRGFKGTDEDYENNPIKYIKDFEAFKASEREAGLAAHAALVERQTVAVSTFDEATAKYDGDKDALKGKVATFLNEHYGQALYTLPVSGGEGVITMKSVIEGAIRAVAPKLFERQDHAAEATRIENIRAAAAMSTAQPKGKPGGPADLTPLQKQGEDHMASLEEVLRGEHFIPTTI